MFTKVYSGYIYLYTLTISMVFIIYFVIKYVYILNIHLHIVINHGIYNVALAHTCIVCTLYTVCDM